MMDWFDSGTYGMGHGFGWIFMLIFWGAIIYLISRAVTNRQPSERNHDKRALGLLKERYAKGEIDKEDFERIKRDLDDNS